MKKETVMSDKAPAAVGPYSHAVKSGNLLFISGQLPLRDGKMPEGIAEQTECCLQNLGYILEEAGSSFEKVLKTTVFILDMEKFGEVNEVYGTFFRENYPARSCFAVKELPKGASVEIEAIAEI